MEHGDQDNMESDTRTMPYRVGASEPNIRPNPLEPHATPEKHPLNAANQLEKPTKADFLRLLLDENVTTDNPRPAKRRRSGEPSSLDLPKPPAVKHGAQRLRIPPTLSGLHQPPPDARLLPSMSMNLIEKPEASQASEELKEVVAQSSSPPPEDTSSGRKQKGAKSNRKHKRWSEQETADLLKGVSKLGIGKWTKILHDQEFRFDRRTALDLKDRFRVCCPDEYREGRTTRPSTISQGKQSEVATTLSDHQDHRRSKRTTDRVSTAELEKLGIDGPFEKSKRRQRTGWNSKEDEALLAGFQVHNNSWATIRDSNSVLKARTTTDLRDRLRTRYPEQYAKSGLTPRASDSSRKEPAHETKESEQQDASVAKESHTAAALPKTATASQWKEPGQTTPIPPSSTKKHPPPTSILHTDDVFWGAPFDPDNTESEPVKLGRGILDWAYDLQRPAMNHDANIKAASIDPLATLNLPRPTATSSTSATAIVPVPTQLASTTASSANPLPSLATITAVADADSFTEPLELPSLMGAFGTLEPDGRTGGHFMSMEELLS